MPGEYHTYHFLNADPADLDLEARFVGLLPDEDPYLQVDPIGRNVTFRAPQDKAQELFRLLKEWDEQVRQVRIEAEILRVNVSLIQELGIRWQAVLQEMTDLGELNKIDVEARFPAVLGTDAAQGRLTIGNIPDDDYTAVLQAIATDNDTEVIASPRILVRDGQEALFSSARDEPYTVVTVDGNTQTTLEDVRFLNVGVSLAVAPRIHRENTITLDTQLEISNLVEVREGIPVVDRATAQSSVSVEDGGTVVLGGLRQLSATKLVRGVPGLRKIPLLGALFRNKRKDKTEFEIVLIIRPHIVGDSQDDVRTVVEIHEEIQSAFDGALN